MNRAILVYTTPYYALAGSSLLVRHMDFDRYTLSSARAVGYGVLPRKGPTAGTDYWMLPLAVVVQMHDGKVHAWGVLPGATATEDVAWYLDEDEVPAGSTFYEAVLPWVRDRLTGDTYPRLQAKGGGV